MANTSYVGVGPADRDPTVSDPSLCNGTAKIQDNAGTGPMPRNDLARCSLLQEQMAFDLATLLLVKTKSTVGTAPDWATERPVLVM